MYLLSSHFVSPVSAMYALESPDTLIEFTAITMHLEEHGPRAIERKKHSLDILHEQGFKGFYDPLLLEFSLGSYITIFFFVCLFVCLFVCFLFPY